MMDEKEATKIIEHFISKFVPLDFDYCRGRLLKVDISGDELDSWLYDRDLGTGLCEHVVNTLLEQLTT